MKRDSRCIKNKCKVKSTVLEGKAKTSSIFPGGKDILQSVKVKSKISNDKPVYESIKGGIKDAPFIKWGKGLKVLIVADHCLKRALEFYEYIKEKTNVSSITLMNNYRETDEYTDSFIPDIIIFVGIQDNEDNYNFKSKIESMNFSVFVIMFTPVGQETEYLCVSKQINHIYDSGQPIANCIAYIKKNFKKM